MGCDIHIFTEIKKNGKWIEADPWITNPDYVTAPEEEKKYYNPVCVPFKQEICFTDRNYALFGILAGVRWENLPRIADPKGLPKDISTNIANEAHIVWNSDGHSFSWLTLTELKEFDWDYEIDMVTYIDPLSHIMNLIAGWDVPKDDPEYHRYGVPPGTNTALPFEEFEQRLAEFFQMKLKLSAEEYQIQRRLGSLPLEKMQKLVMFGQGAPNIYVKYKYKFPLRNYSPEFVNNTIPKLEYLAAQPDVEDVRIVFWFDN